MSVLFPSCQWIRSFIYIYCVDVIVGPSRTENLARSKGRKNVWKTKWLFLLHNGFFASFFFSIRIYIDAVTHTIVAWLLVCTNDLTSLQQQLQQHPGKVKKEIIVMRIINLSLIVIVTPYGLTSVIDNNCLNLVKWCFIRSFVTHQSKSLRLFMCFPPLSVLFTLTNRFLSSLLSGEAMFSAARIAKKNPKEMKLSEWNDSGQWWDQQQMHVQAICE